MKVGIEYPAFLPSRTFHPKWKSEAALTPTFKITIYHLARMSSFRNRGAYCLFPPLSRLSLPPRLRWQRCFTAAAKYPFSHFQYPLPFPPSVCGGNAVSPPPRNLSPFQSSSPLPLSKARFGNWRANFQNVTRRFGQGRAREGKTFPNTNSPSTIDRRSPLWFCGVLGKRVVTSSSAPFTEPATDSAIIDHLHAYI